MPGVTGEMVDTGDAPGLAQAVLRVLADLPTSAAAWARRRVSACWRNFLVGQEAEGIGRVYAQLFAQALSRAVHGDGLVVDRTLHLCGFTASVHARLAALACAASCSGEGLQEPGYLAQVPERFGL
jgi:hypothetical protein